jgi:hypothetical protein
MAFWEYPSTYGMPALYDDVDLDQRTHEALAESVRDVLGDASTSDSRCAGATLAPDWSLRRKAPNCS